MPKRRKVRVGREETFAEVFSRLTRAQQQCLEQVAEAQSSVRATEVRVALEVAILHRAVHDALTCGVPVRLLAEQIGVTPSRIYQMRDLVTGFSATEVVEETG